MGQRFVVCKGGCDCTLIGGPGSNHAGYADTFVFEHFDYGETDTIINFEVGIDRIDLSDTEVSSWSDLNNASDGDFMEQAGSDVVIHTSDNDMVVLENVQMSQLSASDVLF